MRKNGKSIAEADEFKRINEYLTEHGTYPEDANPKVKALVIEFQSERLALNEKMRK